MTEKQLLIDNINKAFAYSNDFNKAWIDESLQDRIVINMEESKILQDEMDDMLAIFGNHSGLSYQIQGDSRSYLSFVIYIQS